MKKVNCSIACPPKPSDSEGRRWVTLLSCLLTIIFVSFLASRFSSPVYAVQVGDPCTTSPDCGLDSWLYCDNGKCTLRSFPESSLEKFQTIVKKSEQKGETNLQWYLGSENGTIDATTNALTGLIVGTDINWDELHKGNVQGARIGGAFGFTSNLIAQVLTQPPVSSTEYFADLGRNFGIVKPAYAQGIGFKGLSNLLPLWKATRNLAYILFVIVFLATGLAIMFRVKLDPKTVVTIQNAIPKLIIALILVTFSYAIVGLLIDLIYLIIYLGVLALQGPIEAFGGDVTVQQSRFTSLSFLDAAGIIFGGSFRGIFSIGSAIVGESLLPKAVLTVLRVILMAPLAVVSALAALIFSVVILFLLLKLFFSLLLCYVSIIISVIVAPLQIMLGALPGSTAGFGSWFRNLLANILVFPAVALFLLIGSLLTHPKQGPIWTPPVMGVGGEGLAALIGLGMLMLVNKVPEMVKAAFKMKPAGYGTAIGEALGPAKFGGKVLIGGGVERGYGYITRPVGGPTWAQPGQIGRGAIDVVKSGIDRVLKKW